MRHDAGNLVTVQPYDVIPESTPFVAPECFSRGARSPIKDFGDDKLSRFPLRDCGNDKTEHTRTRKGLTLLELILALTVLSVVLLGGFSLNMTSARLTADAAEEARLQNELIYMFRDMEINLRDGTNAVPCPNQQLSTFCVQVTAPDGAARSYTYAQAGQTLTRSDSAGNAVLSQGVLQPYAVLQDFDGSNTIDAADRQHLDGCFQNPQVPLFPAGNPNCDSIQRVFSLSGSRIINVSFRVQRSRPWPQSTPANRWITMTKSILLRTS